MPFVYSLALMTVSMVLTGCKLAVIVGEGGDVISQSGLRDCAATSYCVHEITDSSFGEAFTALPRPGFEFVRWQGGTGFQCADLMNRTCIVSLKDNAIAEAIVSSYDVAYIMPVFRDIGIDSDGDGDVNRVDDDDDNDGLLDVHDPCPRNPDVNCVAGASITDTVAAYGREWAQVDLFLGLSWEDINAVCPEGACADFGTLNDYDMTGWVWASVEEVNALFNAYAGDEIMGPGPDLALTSGSVGTAFFNDRWRPLVDDGTQKLTGGYMSDLPDIIGLIGFPTQSPNQTGLATEVRPIIDPGAWFYRKP